MRRTTTLGFVLGVLIAGCGTAPPRSEKGAFQIEDVVRTTGDAIRVQVNHTEVPLQQMPMAALLAGLPMAGLADIAIDLTVPGARGKHDYRKAVGSIAVGCPAGCTLGDDTARIHPPGAAEGEGIPFGRIAFDRIDIRAEVQQGHLKVTRWQLASKDLTLDLELDIQLAAELADSTIDGCLRFKPSDSLGQRAPKTAAAIATTGAPRAADGSYSIKIQGRVGKSRLLGAACT